MSVLTAIIQDKTVEVEKSKALRPKDSLLWQLPSKAPTLGFVRRLRLAACPAIIAEVKLASPSRGVIRSDLRPVDIALAYAAANATCISVLTDEKYFHGHLDYLEEIRAALPDVPLLRKDFIIDSYQLLEARVAGADAVLLIFAALDDQTMLKLSLAALELSLDILLEIHDTTELQRALSLLEHLPCSALANLALGINNRNLSTFVTDLSTTEALLALLPAHYKTDEKLLLVSESGIFTKNDLQKISISGVKCFLVGESLVKEGDPGENLRQLREDIVK